MQRIPVQTAIQIQTHSQPTSSIAPAITITTAKQKSYKKQHKSLKYPTELGITWT